MNKNLLCASISSTSIFLNAARTCSCKTIVSGLSALSLVQTRGLRDDLKARGIEWKEPKKLELFRPEKSGDLEPFRAPDLSRPTELMTYALSEYDSAPPDVQKLLSLEYASLHKFLKVAKLDMLRQTQRHQYDTGSLAAKITQLTVSIRYHQNEIAYLMAAKDPEMRHRMHMRVDRRKKYLRRLRHTDYKQFEWLLEKLNLLYKPRVMQGGPVYRYDSLRKLVNMRCNNLRKAKLAAYKAKLDSQKEEYQQEKKATLQWIKETEEKLGIPVTVDPETGMIEPPLPELVTITKRIFGPYWEDKKN
ncbi:Ribosomal protein S15 [Trinorchestia longiramus]|nr:Ribosomal protein S15 [Trinorchestia longiramus]